MNSELIEMKREEAKERGKLVEESPMSYRVVHKVSRGHSFIRNLVGQWDFFSVEVRHVFTCSVLLCIRS